jgi:hypothetical protein
MTSVDCPNVAAADKLSRVRRRGLLRRRAEFSRVDAVRQSAG